MGDGPAFLTLEDVCTYVVGPVMGFILRLRGLLCSIPAHLHTGPKHCPCGVSQAGKSTTAAALALRGISVLTEDVTPIKDFRRNVHCRTRISAYLLMAGLVKELLGSPDALPLLTPNWDKRYLPLDGVRATFQSEPKPLGAIYLLAPRMSDSRAPRVEEIAPRDALLALVQNTYMNWLLNREQRAAEFDVLSKIVNQIPIRRLIPHADPARLPALCDLIIEDATTLTSNKAYRASVSQPA